jgi:Trehalose utilisation
MTRYAPALTLALLAAAAVTLAPAPTRAADAAAKKKVLFIAGHASHGFGAHDHLAGCHLLADELNASGLPIECTVTYPGWPKDEKLFDGVSAVVIYADGGGGHPMMRNIKDLQKLMDKGVGFGCIHYAVEVPRGPAGDAMLAWTGGYFETYWSVNPDWVIKNVTLAKGHPITRGVKPYEINDEWYYHMRFRPNMEGVTPILSAVPPDSTMRGWAPGKEPQTHGGNPAVYEAVVKNKEPQVLMWARQRPEAGGGGRGFGFTGAHYHWNWENDNQRLLVLNAIAWIAGVEVPKDGVPNKRPTLDQMLTNHDDAPPADKIDRAGIQKKLDALNPSPAAE